MKQHITREQLNKYLELKVENGVPILNFEKQGKVNKFLGIESERNYPPAELITIGKMIEIIDEHYSVLFVPWHISKDQLIGEYIIGKVVFDEEILISYGEELADCLWEVITSEILL